jgi:hypothetical protein
MATPAAFEIANRIVTGVVKLPLQIVSYAATEPVLVGSLLYVLTRGPILYRQRLVRFLQERGLLLERIALLIKSLKYLLAIGVARKVNHLLNRLALNHWHLRKPGAPLQFGDINKSELVVVTGGCSGFGYEMVKSFSKYARVIILDISPVPPELERSKTTWMIIVRAQLTSDQSRAYTTTNSMLQTSPPSKTLHRLSVGSMAIPQFSSTMQELVSFNNRLIDRPCKLITNEC